MFLQFIKFGIVGFSNTAIAYAIYYVFLVYLGQHYIVANTAAFVLSVLNSFFWNDRYVFKRKSDEKRNFWGALLKTYVSYASTGLVLSGILLFIFIELLHISDKIAPLLGLAVTVPLNFVLNKKWAFKS